MKRVAVYILISVLSSIRAEQNVTTVEINSDSTFTFSKDSTFPHSNNKETFYQRSITAPVGYNVLLKCTYVQLSEDRFCSNERLMISNYGDDTLRTGQTFCSQPFEVTSVGNKMTLGYVATVTSNPNHGFNCLAMTKLAPSPCKCGQIQTNKLGSKSNEESRPKATEDSHGFIVGISQTNSYIKCFGAIINPLFVVTAASCVYLWKADDLEIVIDPMKGLSSPTNKIERIIVHEHFLDLVGSGSHDIAVLETKDKFNSFACLPFRFAPYDLSGINVNAFGQASCSNQTVREFKMNNLRINSLYLKDSKFVTLYSNSDGLHLLGPTVLTDNTTKRVYVVGVIGRNTFRENTGILLGNINNFYYYLDWIKHVTLTTYCGENNKY